MAHDQRHHGIYAPISPGWRFGDAVRGMPRGELQVKGLPNPVATHEVAEPAPV